ncbi:MAG: hypothetical protein ACREOI_26410 [bacterium]
MNEKKPAGVYHVNFDGKNLPSGIYFYIMKNVTQSTKDSLSAGGEAPVSKKFTEPFADTKAEPGNLTDKIRPRPQLREPIDPDATPLVAPDIPDVTDVVKSEKDIVTDVIKKKKE